MTHPVRLWAVAGFGAASALLAFLGVSAFRSAEATLTELVSVRTARAELDATRELMQRTAELQSGARGFVITGRDEFLAPHDSAVRYLPIVLGRLRTLLAPDTAAGRLVDSTAGLVAARLAFDAATIAARRTSGAAAATALVASGRGKDLMDRIGADASALEARITYDRARRTDQLEAAARRTLVGVAVASLLALLVVGAAIAGIFRSLASLERADAQVRTLSGLLPICSGCKKIRDDHGDWRRLETYIAAHSQAEFSHGLCPDCFARLYPDLGPYPAAGEGAATLPG